MTCFPHAINPERLLSLVLLVWLETPRSSSHVLVTVKSSVRSRGRINRKTLHQAGHRLHSRRLINAQLYTSPPSSPKSHLQATGNNAVRRCPALIRVEGVQGFYDSSPTQSTKTYYCGSDINLTGADALWTLTPWGPKMFGHLYKPAGYMRGSITKRL